MAGIIRWNHSLGTKNSFQDFSSPNNVSIVLRVMKEFGGTEQPTENSHIVVTNFYSSLFSLSSCYSTLFKNFRMTLKFLENSNQKPIIKQIRTPVLWEPLQNNVSKIGSVHFH